MARLIDADALRNIFAGQPPEYYTTGYIIGLIDRLQTVNGWVSVKDRLPEEQENPYTHDYQEVICCLVTRFGRDVRVYSYGGGHFWHGPQEVDKYVSHWMPFPDLPKEDDHE